MKPIAIPLYGKMAFRSFHTQEFIQKLNNRGLSPVYYVDGKFLTDDINKDQYGLFFCEKYEDLYSRKPILRFFSELRRFLVRTETTQLRFRDSLWDKFIFSDRSIYISICYIVTMDILRRMRFLAPAFVNM